MALSDMHGLRHWETHIVGMCYPLCLGLLSSTQIYRVPKSAQSARDVPHPYDKQFGNTKGIDCLSATYRSQPPPLHTQTHTPW